MWVLFIARFKNSNSVMFQSHMNVWSTGFNFTLVIVENFLLRKIMRMNYANKSILTTPFNQTEDVYTLPVRRYIPSEGFLRYEQGISFCEY